MITKTITYDNYNEDQVTEVFHFHMTKSKLMANLDLQNEIEKLEKKFEGPQRDLTREEVQEILDLVKKLIQLSYGVRSEDGTKFRQGDDVWADFQDSAAYDAILWSLFENPEQAIEFMLGIMPKDLMAQVRSEMETRPAVQDHLSKKQSLRPVETVETEAFDDIHVEEGADELSDDSIEALEARLRKMREQQQVDAEQG